MGQATTHVRDNPLKTRKETREPADAKASPVNLGGETKHLKIRADALKVHPVVQRDLVPSRLKKLVKYMDLDAIGCMHAVEYPAGNIQVIDGQHRLRALLEHGFGEWEVDIKIYVDVKDDQRAADLFLKLDDYSPVMPYDKYRQEVRAGQPEACGVDALAKKFALKVHRSGGEGKVTCVVALKRIWKLDQGRTLGRVFLLVTQAWARVAPSFDGNLLEGIGLVLLIHGDDLPDDKRMVKKLATYPGGPTNLVGHARGLREHRKGALSRSVYEIVLDRFNKGMKSKLEPEL